MSTSYRNGIRYRCIVTAWREEEVEGDIERVINSVERCVYVEVDTFPAGTQVQRAKEIAQGIMQALYPAVNQFDIYNIESELDSPADVLGYVTGCSMGRQCYEAHPIVAFRQQHNPAEYREPDAWSWEQERAEFRKQQLAKGERVYT
jgi:hypothetical protein